MCKLSQVSRNIFPAFYKSFSSHFDGSVIRSIKHSQEASKEPSKASKNQEYLNPINILGIPSAANRRANHERSTTDPSNKFNFKILKNSGRCGMGSLLNLNKIPPISRKTSLQRSNSARECSMLTGRELSMLGGGLLASNHHQRHQGEEERGQVSTVTHAPHATLQCKMQVLTQQCPPTSCQCLLWNQIPYFSATHMKLLLHSGNV